MPNAFNSASNILQTENLSKSYTSAGKQLTVLDHVNMQVEAGSTMAIVGPSGSGKTTLLGLCAGLDSATSGSVLLNGIRLETLSEDKRAEVRNQYVGFIFQNFQLLPTLTAFFPKFIKAVDVAPLERLTYIQALPLVDAELIAK
jgi:putative ABC transport system ATP-binding protein